MTVELASVFAKLRYGAASDFSTLMSPFECALLLQAVGDELVEDLDRRARRGDRLIEALARATEWLVFAEGAEITVGPEDAATLAELVPLEGQS